MDNKVQNNSEVVEQQQAQQQEQPQQQTINLANLSTNDCLNLIWNALNKANSTGAFQIDEAYVLKIAHNNLRNRLRAVTETTEQQTETV